MLRSLLLFLVFATSNASASIVPLKASFQKMNSYIEEGIIAGGETQRDLVLNAIRHAYSKERRTERLVFESMPSQGIPSRIGYFQIAAEPKKNRVVVTLAGVGAASLPLQAMTGSLEKSPLIKKASLTLDPEDRSATLLLEFRKFSAPIQVEAFELTKMRAQPRLVVDLMVAPLKAPQKVKK